MVDVRCIHVHQTDVTFASHGTTKIRDADSSAGESIAVRSALEITLHIPVVEIRKTTLRKIRTRQGEEEEQPPSEVAVPQRSP